MEELQKALKKYYLGGEFDTKDYDRAVIISNLAQYVAAASDADLERTKALLVSLYKEPLPQAAIAFLDESGQPGAAACFLGDAELSGAIKNHYMADLTEQVRFAKVQRANLKDTASYNRHVEKALPTMCRDLTVMFALGAELTETKLVLDKYFEYNYYVNREQNWIDFYTLLVYTPFREFMKETESELLRLYSRTNIALAGVRYLLESGNDTAIKIYFENIAEEASVSRSRADELLSVQIAFPFDGEIVARFADMFDGTHRAAAAKWFLQHQSKYADMAYEIALRYLED